MPRGSQVDEDFVHVYVCVCVSWYVDEYVFWILTILPTNYLIIFANSRTTWNTSGSCALIFLRECSETWV